MFTLRGGNAPLRGEVGVYVRGQSVSDSLCTGEAECPSAAPPPS